jgi:glutathione synthase/RimK-type ligase-like ATP-grasp enzyme
VVTIHDRPGSFSDKWIEYCLENGIQFKVVNCYASDIIEQIEDCDGLMWHWSHFDYEARLFAHQLTHSLEMAGKKVFPDSNTSWHFDDKVGQKYLMESLNIPMVRSYVFYDKKNALEWLKDADFPKVFKLRGGAGSENVKIVKNFLVAKKFINKAFRSGYKVKSRINLFKERLWQFRRDKTIRSLFDISKGILRLFIAKEAERKFPAEKNYAYFQDFISGNDHDIRVIVIGEKAFAIKRMVREGDFRASGSGRIIYDKSQVPVKCLELAFEASRKINSQCLACDFVFSEKKPLLVEISYSFDRRGYLSCPGYWKDDLKWVQGSFYPEYFMIENFLKD